MASRMMATVAPGLQPGSAANGPQTVLVVEDSADDFFLLQRAFSHAGVFVTLVRAVDGDDAKEYLECALAAARLPICILADLRMPGMDGFEFARCVKEHPALSSVPLVILSVSANQKDIARAYQLGVNSYVVKPSTFEALVSISGALRDQWFNANLGLTPPPGAARL